MIFELFARYLGAFDVSDSSSKFSYFASSLILYLYVNTTLVHYDFFTNKPEYLFWVNLGIIIVLFLIQGILMEQFYYKLHQWLALAGCLVTMGLGLNLVMNLSSVPTACSFNPNIFVTTPLFTFAFVNQLYLSRNL